MGASNTVIFVILDAFRWDYLNPVDSPFLWNCAQEGTYVRQLVTACGFTQRSALFCGTFPDKTSNFAMFSLDPENSPFRFLKGQVPLLRLAQRYIDSRFKGSGLLNRWLRQQYIYPRARRYAAHPPAAEIPLYLLPWIGVTEDTKSIDQPGAFAVESIFDILHREKIPYSYLMFPVVNCQDDEALETTVQKVRQHKDGIRAYFLQFSDSDLEVHRHGSEGLIRRKVVGEIDRKLRQLWSVVEGDLGQATLVMVGDHGMMDVDREVDVAAIVHGEAKRHGLNHGRDYSLFLDSTFARLWNSIRSRVVEDFLEHLKNEPDLVRNGRFLSRSDAESYRIPYPDPKYGDLIWWAAPGVLIRPDYFHPRREQVRAMHGYDSWHEKMKGLAVIWGASVNRKCVETARLVDVCPTVCDLLGIASPAANEGKSLCRKP